MMPVTRAELRAEMERLQADVESRKRQLQEWYDKLEAADENLRVANLQIDVLRKALEKHVCVKAMQGDGMNAVDYYPVDEDECELCAVLKPKDAVSRNQESLQPCTACGFFHGSKECPRAHEIGKR